MFHDDTYGEFCISVGLMANEFLRSLLDDVWSVSWTNSHLDSCNRMKNKRKKKTLIEITSKKCSTLNTGQWQREHIAMLAHGHVAHGTHIVHKQYHINHTSCIKSNKFLFQSLDWHWISTYAMELTIIFTKIPKKFGRQCAYTYRFLWSQIRKECLLGWHLHVWPTFGCNRMVRLATVTIPTLCAALSTRCRNALRCMHTTCLCVLWPFDTFIEPSQNTKHSVYVCMLFICVGCVKMFSNL